MYIVQSIKLHTNTVAFNDIQVVPVLCYVTDCTNYKTILNMKSFLASCLVQHRMSATEHFVSKWQ